MIRTSDKPALDLSTTPKDYQGLVKSAYNHNRYGTSDALGYGTDGHAEAACDSYRLHYEHDAVRDAWRKFASDVPDDAPEWTVDKLLVDWLKVAAKFGRAPVAMVDGALQVKDAAIGTARFSRPLPVADEWAAQFGLSPVYLLDAIRYLTRGKLIKPQTITITTHVTAIALHNCTRHAYLMPMKLDRS